MIKRIETFLKSPIAPNVINVFLIFITLRIGISANTIASRQNKISEQQIILATKQTEILDKQTKIQSTQADIQSGALQFEKDKHRTDTVQGYREKIGILYEKIISEDPVLVSVHNKIKDGFKVAEISNLDRYVSEFENIGALYCDGKTKDADLRTILKDSIDPVCRNQQINGHYQNTKSGLSALCFLLAPNSPVAKRKNPQKCPILR